MNDREKTACCGLYCGDCIPSQHALFETAAALRHQLDDWPFERYAEYKSEGNKIFNAYPTFREVLDAIVTLRCPRTCFHGGGNPNCAIRTCARRRGLEGCWQCERFEACETLGVLRTCHGDTVEHNLRMIQQHGVDKWSHTRGRHYAWEKSNPQPGGAEHDAV